MARNSMFSSTDWDVIRRKKVSFRPFFAVFAAWSVLLNCPTTSSSKCIFQRADRIHKSRVFLIERWHSCVFISNENQVLSQAGVSNSIPQKPKQITKIKTNCEFVAYIIAYVGRIHDVRGPVFIGNDSISGGFAAEKRVYFLVCLQFGLQGCTPPFTIMRDQNWWCSMAQPSSLQ